MHFTLFPETNKDRIQKQETIMRDYLSGNITFSVISNNIYSENSSVSNLSCLYDITIIFQTQLPKMPKEYIFRQVFDIKHKNFVLFYNKKPVGAICYRPFYEVNFAEIVFCAVDSESQVKGFGGFMMDALKEHIKSEASLNFQKISESKSEKKSQILKIDKKIEKISTKDQKNHQNNQDYKKEDLSSKINEINTSFKEKTENQNNLTSEKKDLKKVDYNLSSSFSFKINPQKKNDKSKYDNSLTFLSLNHANLSDPKKENNKANPNPVSLALNKITLKNDTQNPSFLLPNNTKDSFKEIEEDNSNQTLSCIALNKKNLSSQENHKNIELIEQTLFSSVIKSKNKTKNDQYESVSRKNNNSSKTTYYHEKYNKIDAFDDTKVNTNNQFDRKINNIKYFKPNSLILNEISSSKNTKLEKIIGADTLTFCKDSKEYLEKSYKIRSASIYLLTYADNYAIGYFKKNGFSTQIKFRGWVGYIKDYDGGTLMQCKIYWEINYLKKDQFLTEMKTKTLKKLSIMSEFMEKYPGISEKKLTSIADIPGVEIKNPEEYLKNRKSKHENLNNILKFLISDLQANSNSWPFLHPVKVEEVPDYYHIIKSPMDLETMEKKIENLQYRSLKEFETDFRLMAQNCYIYNAPTTLYYKCAQNLEDYYDEKIKFFQFKNN